MSLAAEACGLAEGQLSADLAGEVATGTEEAEAGQAIFTVVLSGAAQVPPVDIAATSTADVTVVPEAMTVSWMVTAEGLSGDPVAAHFHGPASPEENAPPVIDISENWMEGSTEITPEQLEMIQNGMTYINIHTEQHPDGEIRGQVTTEEMTTTDASTETAADASGEETAKEASDLEMAGVFVCEIDQATADRFNFPGPNE